MRLLQVLSILALSFTSGCALQTGSVATFHKLPPASSTQTIALQLASPGEASLEGTAYLAKLSQRLAAVGYSPWNGNRQNKPTYVAVFAYGMDDGTLVTENYSLPQYGVTGYTGGANGSPQMPTYGVTGHQSGSSTSRIYKRVIVLNMFDVAKLKENDPNTFAAAKVYEGRVVTDGACASMSGVIDIMLDAMFEDFPGESGEVRSLVQPTTVNPLTGC
jgi:hypothetical protein